MGNNFIDDHMINPVHPVIPCIFTGFMGTNVASENSLWYGFLIVLCRRLFCSHVPPSDGYAALLSDGEMNAAEDSAGRSFFQKSYIII